MSHDMLLLVFLLAPAVVLVLLRINAAAVFLGLCLGLMLMRYAGSGVESFASVFTARLSNVSTSTIHLALLFAPAVVVTVLSVFSVRGRMRWLWNVLPAACVALLGVLLAVPLLAPGLRASFESQALWRQLTNYQGEAVGVGVVTGLIFLLSHRKHGRARRGSEKSK